MNILVTDGNSRASLAITRSLGAKGHRLYVAAHASPSLASCSRYCYQALTYPDPARDRTAFLETILQLISDHDIDVLIPVADICVLPVAEAIDIFEKKCHIPIPSYNSLKQAADKNGLLVTANALNVAVPRSVSVNSFDEFRITETDLSSPIVIKPGRSRVESTSGWIYTHVDYANSADELHSKLRALPQVAYPVILQERITGHGIGMFYCFNHGEPVASFSHKRIREKPPSGGVSVLCESAHLHPQADEFSQKLLRKLNWHGVAMVEFKFDERDQTPKLMEINGRFWGSLQLAIDSGVDFPDLLLQITERKHAFAAEPYKIGVRSRWFWGEVDLLLMHLLKKRKSLNLPAGHDNRLLSIIKILNPFVRNQHFDVLRLSDLKPWIHESMQRLKT